MPVGTKFTAYVRLAVELCGHMVWSEDRCVHGTSCLCALSASAFIELSLNQLDFFFYGDAQHV